MLFEELFEHLKILGPDINTIKEFWINTGLEKSLHP